MAPHVHNPYSNDQKTSNILDRKRQQERKFMLMKTFQNAEELSVRLVQRLIDNHIVETTSDSAMRDVFRTLFMKLIDMDEFDMQYKVAPIRTLVPDPNFVSLYLTQYITEDLMEHPKVQDVFGDNLDIYNTVDSVMQAIRPKD